MRRPSSSTIRLARPASSKPARQATSEQRGPRPSAAILLGSEPLGFPLEELSGLELAELRARWRRRLGGEFPAHLPKWLLVRLMAHRLQVAVFGGLDPETARRVRGLKSTAADDAPRPFASRHAVTKEGAALRPGALLVREWQGAMHRVMALEDGFAWNGETYSSLSSVAKAITGVSWNGHRFFGLRKAAVGRAGTVADG